MPKVLSSEAVDQYRREGYVFPISFIETDEVAACRQKLEAFEAKNGGKLKATERNKSHLLFRWVDDLIHDARLLDAVEDLIGPDILCWNTIFWIKEPDSPSFVSWHQDSNYWGLEEGDVITVWLALSEASEEAGCMRVIPGTHKGRALHHEDTYHDDNMLTRGQEVVDSVIDESSAVAMPLKPGEVSVHSIRTAHASGANKSNDRRIGLSMHFMPPTTRQVVGAWDSAALVRGRDPYGHFAPTPRPASDFDPHAVAFHERAAAAMREVLYHGAAHNTAKL